MNRKSLLGFLLLYFLYGICVYNGIDVDCLDGKKLELF